MATITYKPWAWAYKQVSPESTQSNNRSNLYVGTSSKSGLYYSALRFYSLFSSNGAGLSSSKNYRITSIKLNYYSDEGSSLNCYFYLSSTGTFSNGELLSPYTTGEIGDPGSDGINKEDPVDLTSLGTGILNYTNSDFYIMIRPVTSSKGDRVRIKPSSTNYPISLSITYEEITTAPVTTIYGSFSDGTVGTYYSDSLTCDGDTPITWRVSSGSLPSGLSLSSSGNTCYVSGKPTTAGSYSFGITASNSAGSDTVYYGIKIAPAITAPSSISSTFANGIVGASYSSHVQSNGDTPITWSRYSGTLPPGLTLSAGSNSQQGYLKGTPTTAGSYTFTLRAANSAGSTTKQFTITIANPSYTITASAGTGGTISPSGSISVTSGGSQTFTISPSSGYAINYVSVNGTNKGAITSYTFSNVTSNQTISAYFKKVYTITASAGTGGTISPSGTTTVDSGSSKTYTITPNNGYIINYVEVDGVNKGAITSHTFSNITSNHTITASFKPAVGIYIGDKEVLEIYSKTNNSIIKTITGYINKNGTIEIFYNGD